MLIDSHCHLDAAEFDSDRLQVWAQAQSLGVSKVVIPAVHPDNFATVAEFAQQVTGAYYALGIHPMYVRYCAQAEFQERNNPSHQENEGRSANRDIGTSVDVRVDMDYKQGSDRSVEVYSREPALSDLEAAIVKALDDPLFVGIGEIGLDFFVPEISEGAERERQEHFYQEQLKLAQRYQLPVILHVRRSQDTLLKYLRRIRVPGGIAHAFNGSMQQAQAFIDLGFCLGFGGTLTYPRSLQIRRLATELDLAQIVLETDAPDIPPAFLTPDTQGQRRNSPEYLPRIARELADLRGVSYQDIVSATGANVQRVLTRMS
ncbi:MAG: TatD family hydrolase [Pelistega sp.]|nr:TatD family hydrolase [Pelistega sp.]